MKNFKKSVSLVMALVLALGTFSITAYADNSKVVTLGANLSEEQKSNMYEYFGTNANEVVTIEVTNADDPLDDYSASHPIIAWVPKNVYKNAGT